MSADAETLRPRILLVEDEPAIVDAVEYNLVAQGFQVEIARDGESALDAAHEEYDAVLLDLILPRLSGLEVCRRIRKRSTVPILMLTARADELDRVQGLAAGADDYIAKPFSTAELIERIRANIRRTQMERTSAAAAATREVGHLRLDLANQTARVDGRAVELTQSEFRLLSLLASEPERAFSRREIVEGLWQSSHTGGGRTCDVHVKNLRRKIETDPSHPERIVTVRGIGYMLRAV